MDIVGLERKIGRCFPEIVEKGLQEEILEHGEYKTLKAGDVLMDYNQYIKAIPMLISGVIKVMRQDEDGHEILLYFLGKGDTCPMSFTCCMLNKQSTIRAEVEEDIEMFSVPIKYMDVWMDKYDGWKNFVMRSYSRRFEELLHTIDIIAFKKMDERLWQYLQDKAKSTGKTVFNITHQQIANELNSAREAISRLLKKLEKDGQIKLGRNKIEIIAK
ncbi:MAG: Crp/Fnr family transcriptional regulator [Aureispira sp.]|nr:Crp/Fnr family transcriptional regulator [Aureispira sp.]